MSGATRAGECHRREAETDARRDSGDCVEEATSDGLLLRREGRHDIHVGDRELEVRSDDREQQGGEGQCPPGDVGLGGTEEGAGDSIGDGANDRQDLVADFVHDEGCDDVDD